MQGEGSNPAHTNLFLLQDLEDSSRTRKLADSYLNALHIVADWIKTFVARPNKNLGRAGPVCPFVPEAWERKTLWLAPEQIANQSVPDVVQLLNGYKRLVLGVQPIEGERRGLQSDRRCFHRFVGGSCTKSRQYWLDPMAAQAAPCLAFALCVPRRSLPIHGPFEVNSAQLQIALEPTANSATPIPPVDVLQFTIKGSHAKNDSGKPARAAKNGPDSSDSRTSHGLLRRIT